MKILMHAFLGALIACFAFSALYAQSGVIATVQDLKGAISIKAKNDGRAESAKKGMQVLAGSTVTASSASSITLMLVDGSLLSLNENTSVIINENLIEASEEERRASFGLIMGNIRAKVKKEQKNNLRISTPTAIAAVRGTEFEVALASDGSTMVVVDEGVVNVKAAGGSADLREGDAGSVLMGEEKEGVMFRKSAVVDFIAERDRQANEHPEETMKKLENAMTQTQKDANDLLGKGAQTREEARALNDQLDAVKTANRSILALSDSIRLEHRTNKTVARIYKSIERITVSIERANARYEAQLKTLNEQFSKTEKMIDERVDDATKKLDSVFD